MLGEAVRHGHKLLGLETVWLTSFSSSYCVGCVTLLRTGSPSCRRQDAKGSRTVYGEGVLNSRSFFVFPIVKSQDDAL